MDARAAVRWKLDVAWSGAVHGKLPRRVKRWTMTKVKTAKQTMEVVGENDGDGYEVTSLLLVPEWIDAAGGD